MIDLQVIKEGERYVAKFDFDFYIKDVVKDHGFRWEPSTKTWWTNSLDQAIKLAETAEDHFGLSQLLELQMERVKVQQETLKQSKALSSDKIFPAPKGLKYLPYQRAGIEFASGRDAVLIADEMGLGKTIQAIGAINNTPDARNILILCPKSLKQNWLREMEKWDVKGLTIEYNRDGKVFPSSDVVILNYDVVKKFRDEIDAREWDVLVCDESHYLKGPKSSRTRSVLGHGKKISPIIARKRIFLSGTPVVNRPIDLWTTVNACDPNNEIFGHYMRFIKNYCDAFYDGFGWQTRGASNLDELQTKLRSTFMIRRLKKDVLTELPNKRRQVIVLPLNGADKFVTAENQLRFQQDQIQKDLEKALREGDLNTVAQLKTQRGYVIQEIAKARVDIGVAKVPYVVEHVRNALTQGRVVLFAHHHLVFDHIEELLSKGKDPVKMVKVVGNVSANNRQKAIDDFQSGKADLFLGGLRAASEGINLTKSHHVIFAEQDWTDAIMQQAEDRCHRIGQVHNVLVQQLVLDESYDCNMAHKIHEKGHIADLTLNVA